MGRGLLAAAFDFSTAHADEFHDWYDLEHMPERKAIPGFGACERWIGDEQPDVSVASVRTEAVHSYEEMVSLAEATVRSEDFARPGELVVVVAGIPFGQSGSTNNLRIIRIGG